MSKIKSRKQVVKTARSVLLRADKVTYPIFNTLTDCMIQNAVLTLPVYLEIYSLIAEQNVFQK